MGEIKDVFPSSGQRAKGIIHIVTSKGNTSLHIELNEAWVLKGGEPASAPAEARDVRESQEKYPDGRTEAVWSATGAKQWERSFAPDGVWDWMLYDKGGRITAQSRWRGKQLLEADTQGALAR